MLTRISLLNLVLPMGILISGLNSHANGEVLQRMWDMHALSRAPRPFPATEYEPKGEKAIFFEGDLDTPELREMGIKDCRVRSLFYEGPTYRGKPTRVFAFYGVPKSSEGKKLPAVVLVHGGGGSAFESWVRLWNARGYAAIAMDVCGCVPEGSYANWKRHDAGGPPGWGGFDQVHEPLHDQWTYHAVADIILANSLLRSFPEVDPGRIGITGISWGGYLACIAAGVDNRFKFAVPVYGCGFLGENSVWLGDFARMPGNDSSAWLRRWDPSEYLPGASMPMLWVTGTNDFAYPMDSLQKSYRLPKGPRYLCVRLRMGHGHGGLGENPEEIHAFADSICNKTKPLVKITKQGVEREELWAAYASDVVVRKAELIFTRDAGPWPDRKWETAPATVEKSRVTAAVAKGTRVCYLNLIDDRGLVVSTEHMEIPEAVQ